MCVIVNLIYRNEFGFESQILLKHMKYINLCALKKLTINEVRRIMSLLERLFKTLYLWENIPKITTFNIL